jgi:hypothetical protein
MRKFFKNQYNFINPNQERSAVHKNILVTLLVWAILTAHCRKTRGFAARRGKYNISALGRLTGPVAATGGFNTCNFRSAE